ncbi:MAG: aldehyde dehydrogenase [Gemmatimonadaceae bacterium]|nr:aldehyde dehydrogenase [Gemmatimonadaceae bacterium]|tara:strand:- start:13 stop:1584 length:1572 start_codon:yes stop_codon:yes gene_type:complete
MTNSCFVPRVTYSNVHEDFTEVHRILDSTIGRFGDKLGCDHANIISGKEDRDGKSYRISSPIDGSIDLGTYVDASQAAVGRAVEVARAAQPAWAKAPWEKRVSIVRRVASILEARKYELAVANLIEVGKSRMEAMGEVEEAADLARFFCNEMEANHGYSRALGRAWLNERTLSILKPYGVFGIVAPYNFPVALSVKMLAPALVSGNSVVYKPSPGAGLTGSMVFNAFIEGGVPHGVINLICGEESGPFLSDADVDGIVFTGSHDAGMSIFRKFANGPYMRPVLAEMGGKNPVYVTKSADLDVAAEGVARSAFGLQGQKCSAVEVAYVDTSVYDSFVEKLLAFTKGLKIGDPRDPDVFVGPVISGDAVATFESAVESAEKDGKILFGGQRLSGKGYASDYYVEPTIVADLPADHRLYQDELFLPFLALARYDILEQALTRGNSVKYGLTAGAYAEGTDLDMFLDGAEAGVLYANRASGATTGAWPGFQTFAGWKGSGLSGVGGFGPNDLQQFMREQSHTVMESE